MPLTISCSLKEKFDNQLDWLFINYMPYDNNLSGYGSEILNMLKSGINSNNVSYKGIKHFSLFVLNKKYDPYFQLKV